MSDEEDTVPVMMLRGERAADRLACAAAVRTFGKRVGLCTMRAEELAIAASELASNVARDAESGTIELRLIGAPRAHILLVWRDRGPAVPDPDSAFRDGFSRPRTLTPDASRRDGADAGLGSVQRLVDEVSSESIVGLGTTVTARKWLS